ncbi:substrate-binding domain-containing protein [Pseudozobellia thermophila]|uniref:Transcriptional regulator, LacI family n=1 Tax=Pseudozobellia thermophila TaxID=192903 RepID=A0A1M6NL24_9FLAO|nr:substrate-binding domain-containing protein [Pseudozobellia thermophila]SHJ96366.1 transcriptional regulator, LacI family [Pseudozobellia thermophila]
MIKTKKTTIQDLANYANVSIGTVDRVIHNRGKVSPAKQKKVEEAIKNLNFNPNLLARTLALGKHFVVCSLFPRASDPNSYWSLPKRGVEEAVGSYRDFGLVCHSMEYSLFDESSFIESAEAIIEMNPDGVVLAPLFEKESRSFIKKLDDKKIPYVFVDAIIPNQRNLSYIGPDLKGSGHVAGRLMSSILNNSDNILILNFVKGLENSHINMIEKGFREFFKASKEMGDVKINSVTIPSIEEADITRELTKYYIKNSDIQGVFVTNSRAHIIAKYHAQHELPIKLIGFDMLQANILEMKKGNIDFLISQRPISQGTMAIKTLFDFFVQKKSPTKIQHVPLDIIIKENIDYYIKFQESVANDKDATP